MWPFSRKPARPEPTPLERYNRLRELGWNEYDASMQSGFTPGQGDNGGPFGACPMCLAARGDMPTGRNTSNREDYNSFRAEELGRAQAERYTAEHRYQRPAEPERYNNQTEREVEMWQPPTREEFNAWANETWQEIQAAPLSNTPDGNYQPTAAEQRFYGGEQARLEARNNDGSTDIGAHYTGSVGNFAHANLRQARADAGGVWVRVNNQDIFVED